MTQEYKELLIKDISARLPYGIKVGFETSDCVCKTHTLDLFTHQLFALQVSPKQIGTTIEYGYGFDYYRPYLRSMSTMTKEEFKEYSAMLENLDKSGLMYQKLITTVVDWLDKKMFDHRGLIPKKLALEAPEGMYKTE